MLLKLENIHKSFEELQVLKNFSLEVQKNEIFCIIGPSGCGKSTVLNIISGLLNPGRGRLVNHAQNTSYVFQEDRLLPWKNVYENISIVNNASSKEHCLELIYKVGLAGFENQYPDNLSGGMRQRCAIARSFNYDAELLLMDEPFKSLDYSLKFNMIDHLLAIWKDSRRSIIFVTHEIDEALLLGNRIAVLSNRPTRILQTFEIKTEQKKRILNQPNLVEIRNKIISLLHAGKKKVFAQVS